MWNAESSAKFGFDKFQIVNHAEHQNKKCE